MTTSGTQSFKSTRDQIIIASLRKLGVYGQGRTVSADDLETCIYHLNLILKLWSTDGLHLWEKNEGVLYLSQYGAKYSLGNASTDAKVTLASDEIVTQLDGALATSATAVAVTSTTGMAVADYIGVILEDKSLHWTTIATIPSSTTLTLTTGVTGVANDEALVYTFTNKIFKPLRILGARIVTGIDNGGTSTKTEVLLNSIGYKDYFDLNAKTNNGRTNSFHYNPKLLNGNMYIWPRPSDCNYRIEFTYERVIEDINTATQNFDIPAEWEIVLVYQLAGYISPEFGKGKKANEEIWPIARELKLKLEAWDTEITSMLMQPDEDE